MSFKEYKEWFEAIFGKEATETILDEEHECISKKNDLTAFFNSYDRIKLATKRKDQKKKNK